MEGKKSFIIYIDKLKTATDSLSDEELGQLFRAICAYHCGETYEPSSPLASLTFKFFLSSFRESEEKYERIVERRREAGRKGNEKRWGKNIANAADESQSVANIADTVTNTVNVTDVSIETEEELVKEESPIQSNLPLAPVVTSPRFIPPTLAEMQQYAAEKYPSTPLSVIEDCYNYYESNGWNVGKNKMKKWHNALARWISQSNIKNTNNAVNNNPYQRRLAAEQQLGQALAIRYAAELEQERAGEGKFVPRPLSKS